MAEPRKAPKGKEVTRKPMHVIVDPALWDRFRSVARWPGRLSVTEALEQAIEAWLAHENSE